MAMLPDVPTIDEAGVKGYDMGYWFAAYVPAGTPAAVVARLHDLLVAGVKGAGAKQFFEVSGGEPWTTSQDELAKFQAAETRKWGVIKAAVIQAGEYGGLRYLDLRLAHDRFDPLQLPAFRVRPTLLPFAT
jgi:tripartite-type tricarboxylate transporter receptor subunit TctC